MRHTAKPSRPSNANCSFVDLLKLTPATEHPHGLTDRDFGSLFTTDKPIIFNFHGYPWFTHVSPFHFARLFRQTVGVPPRSTV